MPPEYNDDAIMLNGVPIERAGRLYQLNVIKFLGIRIDETLTWRKHISHLGRPN